MPQKRFLAYLVAASPLKYHILKAKNRKNKTQFCLTNESCVGGGAWATSVRAALALSRLRRPGVCFLLTCWWWGWRGVPRRGSGMITWRRHGKPALMLKSDLVSWLRSQVRDAPAASVRSAAAAVAAAARRHQPVRSRHQTKQIYCH